MLERHHEQLLSTRAFAWRVARFAGMAGLLLLAALGIGVAGYHWIAGLGVVDAILNAAMILTGMGPVGELHGTAAKLFASAYALFSGIVFLSAAAVLVAPVAHRILHLFHVDDADR